MSQRAAQNPVAFLGGGIGDAVLALPTLRALADSFRGRLSLVWQGGDSWEFLFHGLPLDKRLRFWFDPTTPQTMATVIASLGQCDLFVSLVPWKALGVRDFMRMLKPAMSIGFFFDDFDIRLPWDESKHAMDQLFQAAQALARIPNFEDFTGPLKFSSACIDAAGSVVKQLSIATYLLAFHNQTERRKMWPPKKLNTLLHDFLDDHDEFVGLSLGVRTEEEGAEGIQDKIIELHQIPLAASFYLLSQADLFLGADSSMLHAADILRTPGVGIFGPTSPSEFGFRLAPGISLQGDGSTDRIEVHEVRAALERSVELCCDSREPRRVKRLESNIEAR